MRPRKQGGYLLLPVVVVLVLVATIALLISSESALESNIAASELDAQRAQYVAAAGLNHALWQVRQQGCGPYTDISNHPLGPDNYGTNLITDLGSTSTYTISVDQDSWIRSDQPTVNKAADLKLHTRNEAAGVERPLLRYDLSPIAVKSSILSATAWFYITNDHAEGPIDIHRISADWTETDATWDSMNTNMYPAVLATIPSQPATGLWIPVNLTAQVQAWVNGETNFGITLNSTFDGVHGQYNSRESANPPWLEVRVGSPPTSPAILKSIGTLTNGVQRTIVRDSVMLPQTPSGFVQLQPGDGDGKDSYFLQGDPNFGGSNILRLSTRFNGFAEDSRIVLQFDTGSIPWGAQILSAHLELYQASNPNGTSGYAEIHRITSDWTELDVTWIKRAGSDNWADQGGDYDPEVMARTLVDTSAGWYSWDISKLVEGWMHGSYPNYGLLIRSDEDNLEYRDFNSSEHGSISLRPKLTVTYSCACGSVCVAPQGSDARIVMIGDWSGSKPDPRDLAKEAIIESWGYEVDHTDDNFIWTIDFNDYDLAYISETASSTAVIGQISWRSIGVVNEQGNLNQDFGFATGKGTSVGDSVDITDNGHYISIPFALGELPIYSAAMELVSTSGTLAGGGQTLAEAGGAESLMLLDKGASSVNGPAAGKRVALPLGRVTNSNFDWTYLNNNGRLLVQRSIEWASGGGKLPAVGALLLIVDDDGNLTTQENAKRALFESWNYSVSIIDSGDSQAAYDAAVAVNDVVYITEDVNSGDVNTKLVDASIGVVTEEDNLADEFGLADGIHWGSGTSLDIDNSHYITQPLAAGNVTILTATESLADLTGALAPDLRVIGDSSDGPALATIDSGDALILGGSAAGRRVILPWGGSDFDVNHLNDDGLTILRRSLEWAAGAGDSGGFYLDEFPDFSCDGADEYRGSNGPLDWSGVAWVESGDDGRACGANLRVLDDPLIDDPVGNRLRLQNNNRTVERLVDLDSFAVAYLSFDYRRDDLSGGAAFLVEVSGDGGGSWNTLDTIGAGDDSTYSAAEYDISAYMAADTMIRFASNANFSGEAYIDNVRIDQSTTATGPVAHWKLDDGAGLTAIDSEGGHDGTLINGPAWVAGLVDGALDFDGSNDHVAAGSFDVVGSGITLMGWFNADSLTTDDERIVSKASGTAEAQVWWQLSSSNAGSNRYLRMRIKAGGTTNTLADSSTDLSTGSWYLAVATYDSASGMMRLYLNGVEVASTAHTVGGALDADASVPVAIGANGTAERFFDGILDDVRIYDRALDATEIVDIYNANKPLGASAYTETYQPWSASDDDTWETFSLASFGVPPDAVVEVAIVNADDDKQQWGGVRAVGSSLERRFLLHEPESGGVDVATLHVQTDASSQVQHYTSKKGDTSFVLLGYWIGATYVERFDSFSAGASNSWQTRSLAGYGVGPNQVVEISAANEDTGAERYVGMRRAGATYDRRLALQEAESGGVDAGSVWVAASGSTEIEVYAQNDGDIEFRLLGYWSTPPGSFTETGLTLPGSPASDSTWHAADLSGLGVPGDAVLQILTANNNASAQANLGVRQSGSTLNRFIQLHEAESGGSDFATQHANADASSTIEWYDQQSGLADRFFLTGWWVLAP